jgi:4'-phosphopantetheinyl transferase EntD
VVEGPIADGPDTVWPEEAAAVARAVPKRQAEFVCGRRFARAAFRKLGVGEQAILPDADRAPIWPRDIVGSITHSDYYCAVAVAHRTEVSAIGIDVEDAQRFRADFAPSVLLQREIAINLAGLSEPQWLARAAVLFSAKEAVYKCLYPLVRMWIGFHDVEVELDPASESFQAQLLAEKGGFAAGRVLTGRYVLEQERVATAVLISATA